MGLRTALGRARGLGSAKDGVSHWWLQRVTSVALVPLMLWLIFSFARVAGADYTVAVAWVAVPMNTVLLVLSVGVLFFHAQLGLRVIIEDYVHHEGLKFASLLAMQFAVMVLAVIGIVAILRVALGA